MKMPIGRHLGTPNSSFSFASLDVIECVIQYYTDQWGGGEVDQIDVQVPVPCFCWRSRYYILMYLRYVFTLI